MKAAPEPTIVAHLGLVLILAGLSAATVIPFQPLDLWTTGEGPDPSLIVRWFPDMLILFGVIATYLGARIARIPSPRWPLWLACVTGAAAIGLVSMKVALPSSLAVPHGVRLLSAWAVLVTGYWGRVTGLWAGWGRIAGSVLAGVIVMHLLLAVGQWEWEFDTQTAKLAQIVEEQGGQETWEQERLRMRIAAREPASTMVSPNTLAVFLALASGAVWMAIGRALDRASPPPASRAHSAETRKRLHLELAGRVFRDDRARRLTMIPVVLLWAGVLWLTGSKTCLLAIPIGLIAAYGYVRLHRDGLRAAVSAVVVLGVVVMAMLMRDPWLEKVRDLNAFEPGAPASSIDSICIRATYWNTALNVGLHQPLLGAGPGCYQEWMGRFRPANAGIAREPHSLLFATLSEWGGPAALLFIAGAALWMHEARRWARSPSRARAALPRTMLKIGGVNRSYVAAGITLVLTLPLMALYRPSILVENPLVYVCYAVVPPLVTWWVCTPGVPIQHRTAGWAAVIGGAIGLVSGVFESAALSPFIVIAAAFAAGVAHPASERKHQAIAAPMKLQAALGVLAVAIGVAWVAAMAIGVKSDADEARLRRELEQRRRHGAQDSASLQEERAIRDHIVLLPISRPDQCLLNAHRYLDIAASRRDDSASGWLTSAKIALDRAAAGVPAIGVRDEAGAEIVVPLDPHIADLRARLILVRWGYDGAVSSSDILLSTSIAPSIADEIRKQMYAAAQVTPSHPASQYLAVHWTWVAEGRRTFPVTRIDLPPDVARYMRALDEVARLAVIATRYLHRDHPDLAEYRWGPMPDQARDVLLLVVLLRDQIRPGSMGAGPGGR